MAVLEGQTGSSSDHSASDNLFMRSLHLRERHTPGYSYVPVGGFEQLFETVGSIAERCGAQVQRGVEVAGLAVERGRHVAVAFDLLPSSITIAHGSAPGRETA